MSGCPEIAHAAHAKEPRALSLGHARRLHHPWQYRRFFGSSEVFRLSECVVFRVPNDAPGFRLGITLKARGSSVDRNRTKRQVRESMRRHAPVLGSYDYNVVVPGSRRLSHDYAARLGVCLRNELSRALARR